MQVLTVFAEELLNLHRGQGMDLYWRDSLTCPTEQEYIDMVSNSGSLIWFQPSACPADQRMTRRNWRAVQDSDTSNGSNFIATR